MSETLRQLVRPARGARAAGFTLLEVLVAAVILVLVFFGIAQVYARGRGQVDFEEESVPAAVVNVRYEYREALVRLGVLPRVDDGLARRERSRGFSDSGFAPDPYRN